MKETYLLLAGGECSGYRIWDVAEFGDICIAQIISRKICRKQQKMNK